MNQKSSYIQILKSVPQVLTSDTTGNGLGLAEWAQENYGHERIEAVKITTTWYLENMPRMKGHFEDQTIELVRDADIRDDVRAVKLVRGIPSIPDKRNKGRHGDAAVGLVMMLAALKTDVEDFAYQSDPQSRSRYAAQLDDMEDDDDLKTRMFSRAGQFGGHRGAW